jgi:2',3'-cyclic-nucleotide 2'-phosphodiesterase/3'-nucleotidase
VYFSSMKTKLLVLAGMLMGLTLLAQQPQRILKIAVTTDVHGAYFPADWFTGKSIPGSLAQVSTWVKDQRSRPDQDLILLDNGDLIQGDPASYYSNYIDTAGLNIAARILNYMGYDAASVGNHDIEAGHPVYDKLVKEFRFPWLAANAVRISTQKPWFHPYTVIRRAGYKVAIIGLITPKIPDWLPRELWSGMEYQDMIESARYWINQVESKEKPDLIVGLFHAGVDAAYGAQSATKPLNENASRLVAEQVAGFDIIFTGHDHRHWNLKVAGPSGDSVLILGSESRAEEIAVATVRAQGHEGTGAQGHKGTRAQGHKGMGAQGHKGTGAQGHGGIRGEHVIISDYTPDPEFMHRFSGYIDTVQKYVDQPVGIITKKVSTEDSYFGPSGFTDLIHRAQLDLTGADISFTAPLSFRAFLEAGTLTVKDLFKLYRFENQLYTIKLSGREILGYLNFSYSLWMKQMKGPDDPMLNMQLQTDGAWRLRNASYNFDSALGIDYIIDLSKPAGSMVTIRCFSDGRPFEEDKTYTVAMNSYRASGGGNHLLQGAGLDKTEAEKRIVKSSSMDFRFLLTGWIRKQGTVDPVSGTNWKVIPEDWIQKAAPRDKARLFGPAGSLN